MAFTDYETEQLHKALLKETRRCAVTLGMKKTSVEQLTKKEQIGELYPQVLETLVYGACRELFE